jgi:uncharacterized membrane protein
MPTTAHSQDLNQRLERVRPPKGGPWINRPDPGRTDFSISDLVGGRVLAWIGGIATLVGIVLFLALAISRGWLTIDARVVGAGIASAALGAAGIWLHGRRGRTEASVVLVGAGTAGLFATLVVAGNVYDLIPPLAAVDASIVVGGLATVLAVRWAGRAIGALGLLGALMSPVLVGAPPGPATTAVVALASGCAVWTVISQRWGWLGLAAVLAAAPQWGWWILNGQPVAIDLGVLSWFAALGIAAAVGLPARSSRGRTAISPLLLAGLSACLVGPVGWVALERVSTSVVAALWLAGLAAIHLVLGLQRAPRVSISTSLRRLLIGIGVILTDVAFGLLTSGIELAIGWGAAAVGFAWLTRGALGRGTDNGLLGLATGAHIALTLIRVLLIVPPGLVGGNSGLVSLLAVGVLAASCLVSGQLISVTRWRLDLAFNTLGLAAVAYLTSQVLTGPELVAAWAAEATALGQLARRTGDDLARYAGLGFLALAALHTLAIEAPPAALLTGVKSLTDAAIALGALALASLRIGRTRPGDAPSRRALLAAGAGSLLYLASAAIITTFQPVGAGQEIVLLDLSVRQEGQVLLSACWSLTGLVALIVGLRRNRPAVRNAALGLLLVTVAKVFAYDLSTLTSLYRVASFIALGLLLLSGAFAYQRLRPPPPPDLRSLHESQR